MRRSEPFYKRPAEQYLIYVQFANNLPPGAELASGTVTAYDQNNQNVSGSVLGSTSASVSGTQAIVEVKAGNDGDRITIKFVMTMNDGQILQENVIMLVREEF
jgi:hypothetical protein